MNSPTPFRILAGLTGTAFVLLGLALVATFIGYQQPGSTPQRTDRTGGAKSVPR